MIPAEAVTSASGKRLTVGAWLVTTVSAVPPRSGSRIFWVESGPPAPVPVPPATGRKWLNEGVGKRLVLDSELRSVNPPGRSAFSPKLGEKLVPRPALEALYRPAMSKLRRWSQPGSQRTGRSGA